MKTTLRCLGSIVLALWTFALLDAAATARAQDEDGKLRVIVFGAHPDDAELKVGGTAALWAKQGHHVKFVSVTNGDIGHHEIAGGPLAQRRTEEVERCAEILGIETEVLDIHDGELLPTLEHRKTITKLIREWEADLVISHRPNDYHPDHRYTAILVQDAAFMVIVPYFCPDVPALRTNPVFMYAEDRFQKPNPFTPDVVVPIDEVLDLKVQCIDALASQFYEWNPWLFGYLDEVPDTPEERMEWTRERAENRWGSVANRFRDRLVELLGEERGNAVQTAEAFELAEYGSQPRMEDLLKMFPLPERDD